jgi:hypothetical protein
MFNLNSYQNERNYQPIHLPFCQTDKILKLAFNSSSHLVNASAELCLRSCKLQACKAGCELQNFVYAIAPKGNCLFTFKHSKTGLKKKKGCGTEKQSIFFL